MLQRLVSRCFRIGALGAVVLFSASQGQSEPDHSKARKACSVARKAAHALEDDGHLRQAREAFVSCSKAACSPVVRQDCTTRYAQLAHDIPTIVPLVTDEAGTPLVDVQVTMDGAALTSRLDGRAIAVDPGMHEFSFSTDAGMLLTQKIMIVQGQRNQPVSIAVNTKNKQAQKRNLAPTLAMSPPLDAKSVLERSSGAKPPLEEMPADKASEKVAEKATPEKKEASTKDKDTTDTDEAPLPEIHQSGPGPMPYVLTVAGLAGLGAGGALFYWGRKDNSLLAQCSPNCAQSSVDHVRQLYLASDVALGAGLAAFGTGVIWLIAGSGPSREKPPGYAIDLRPAPSGGFASVSGSF